MSRRPRSTRRPKAGTRAPARSKPVNSYTPPEHDPLSDSRLRPLVERYASLAGATLDEVGPHVVEMRVPEEDRAYFGDRERILLAFAVGAIERTPDAEMAVVGSPFVEQLLAAIRARGARLSLGLVGASSSPDDTDAPRVAVPVRNATVGTPSVRVARHPVGRLLARVLIRAGASVEEHLVESSYFDLATGTPLPANAAETCVAVEKGRLTATKPNEKRAPERAEARPVGEVVDLMVADLQGRLAPRVDHLRAEAARALTSELERIDAYYKGMLEDAGAKESDGVAMAEAGRAIQAEHVRRRKEEERRHQVHAVVHPLQMVDLEMVVQRAEWTLSTKGQRATLVASRHLGGTEPWSLSCPTCAQTPSALIVVGDDQIACDSCAQDCSVCYKGFRVGDGTGTCHVDGAAACTEHARTCSSCERTHCSMHDGECSDGEHRVCTSCLAPCAQCQEIVCATHAIMSGDKSPMGSRRLCSRCVVYCEGRRNEPIGRDEASECATCDRFVCEKHQETCAVDGKPHCASHLMRTDQSRRLVCEADRVACAHEPDTVFAVDEVSACPVCSRKACPAHFQECTSCGRRVCVGEWEETTSHCATCRRLVPDLVLSPAELEAAVDAATVADGPAPDAKKMRAARDATHLVVEMSHGWRRRIVFAVRHDKRRPDSVMSHSRSGSKRAW
jgi:hypothetical protein